MMLDQNGEHSSWLILYFEVLYYIIYHELSVLFVQNTTHKILKPDE